MTEPRDDGKYLLVSGTIRVFGDMEIRDEDPLPPEVLDIEYRLIPYLRREAEKFMKQFHPDMAVELEED